MKLKELNENADVWYTPTQKADKYILDPEIELIQLDWKWYIDEI